MCFIHFWASIWSFINNIQGMLCWDSGILSGCIPVTCCISSTVTPAGKEPICLAGDISPVVSAVPFPFPLFGQAEMPDYLIILPASETLYFSVPDAGLSGTEKTGWMMPYVTSMIYDTPSPQVTVTGIKFQISGLLFFHRCYFWWLNG